MIIQICYTLYTTVYTIAIVELSIVFYFTIPFIRTVGRHEIHNFPAVDTAEVFRNSSKVVFYLNPYCNNTYGRVEEVSKVQSSPVRSVQRDEKKKNSPYLL